MKKPIFKKLINNKAAIMIEVLIAIIIMSVCLTVIIRSLISSLSGIVVSRDYSLAMIHLDNKMFDLMKKTPLSVLVDEKGSFPEPSQRFDYEIKNTNVLENEDAAEFYTVDCHVSWLSGVNTKKLTVSTYLPKEESKE